MDSPDINSLLNRLAILTRDLADDHKELATVLKSENECKVQAYLSTEGTEGYKSHVARLQALNLTGDVFTLKGAIAAKEAERTYLLTAIDHFSHLPLLSHLPAE